MALFCPKKLNGIFFENHNVFQYFILNDLEASAHLSCPGEQEGPRTPLKFYQGGPSQFQGGLLRSNFNPKNHDFSDDFTVTN